MLRFLGLALDAVRRLQMYGVFGVRVHSLDPNLPLIPRIGKDLTENGHLISLGATFVFECHQEPWTQRLGIAAQAREVLRTMTGDPQMAFL